MPNQHSFDRLRTGFFNGRIIKGSGVGSAQGIPTLNINLVDIPADLEEGIYAARVTIGEEVFGAAVHYGGRPVHGLGRSFEAHLLTEKSGTRNPKSEKVTVEIVKRLRDVGDFGSKEELKKQITRDIDEAERILAS